MHRAGTGVDLGAAPRGRVCVGFGTDETEPAVARSPTNDGWCGETTLAAGSSTERELVLRPAPRDWTRIYGATDVDLTGPGLPGRIASDATGALLSFVMRLDDFYRLPCHSAEECGAADR